MSGLVNWVSTQPFCEGDRREALPRIVELANDSVNHLDGAEDCPSGDGNQNPDWKTYNRTAWP